MALQFTGLSPACTGGICLSRTACLRYAITILFWTNKEKNHNIRSGMNRGERSATINKVLSHNNVHPFVKQNANENINII